MNNCTYAKNHLPSYKAFYVNLELSKILYLPFSDVLFYSELRYSLKTNRSKYEDYGIEFPLQQTPLRLTFAYLLCTLHHRDFIQI